MAHHYGLEPLEVFLKDFQRVFQRVRMGQMRQYREVSHMIRTLFSGHYFHGCFRLKDAFCIQPASSLVNPTVSFRYYSDSS